ncbi:MAG: tetratricopeptide repeat protein [Bacteroidales bacterium]|nr:tetratricopeptide repeat protein [Bacteroidales bacterium]
MNKEKNEAETCFERAVALRQSGQFGEAINAFREAAELAENGLEDAEDGPERDALQEIIKKSLASVELIQEINGFVNTDLMNP